MSPEKINNSTYESLKILVAPLDWGLGHATRCIPIIKELEYFKCDVRVAGSPQQIALLRQEFPGLDYRELAGYGIRYGRNRFLTLWRIILQIPKILIRIKREKAWLAAFIAAEKPDLVISDNRYGLHAPGVYCVFITHQLAIRPPGISAQSPGRRTQINKWGESLLQWIHYRAIVRFDRCWIPDRAEDKGLAGELSHPDHLPSIPTRYIGILSRMENNDARGPSFDLIVLLSGPEPQRSILERKILRQAEGCEESILLVRGVVGGGEAGSYGEDGVPSQETLKEASRQGVFIHDHIPAVPLNKLINAAQIVLARAGYSTIMDLATLDKPAILVPTPGQTEQEYLGHWLAGKGAAICVEQDKLDLPNDLRAARAAFSGGKGGWGTMQEVGGEVQAGGEPLQGDGASLLRQELREVLEIVKKGGQRRGGWKSGSRKEGG